jgi:hypothetical protein
VNKLILGIVDHILAYKVIDTKELAKLKGIVFEELSRLDDKVFNINLTKKLTHFAEAICDVVFVEGVLDIGLKTSVLGNIYQNLLKKGAHYLRQDSLQVLRTVMETDFFVTNDTTTIESKYDL